MLQYGCANRYMHEYTITCNICVRADATYNYAYTVHNHTCIHATCTHTLAKHAWTHARTCIYRQSPVSVSPSSALMLPWLIVVLWLKTYSLCVTCNCLISISLLIFLKHFLIFEYSTFVFLVVVVLHLDIFFQ